MASGFISYLWNKWNIRGFVILSLSLQIFLILFAHIRKQTMSNFLIFPLWLAYLMANWVNPFAVGLISHNQRNSGIDAAEVEGALQAFWTSFILLHFGGPDAIAAFSLVDSTIWNRYLVSFLFQVGAAVYVFGKIFPSDKLLVIPTMLVFLSAFIKNVDRLRALYLSDLLGLSEWVLLEDTFSNCLYEELIFLEDKCFNEEEAELDESTMVKHAYCFFQIFKIFITDFIFTRRERKMSCKYFHKVSAMDALRIISVELQFIYEVLHTKALAIRSKRSYIFRFIAFTNIVMACILFNRLKKHQLLQLDVGITYCLILGAIALDVISMIMLVFSDWTVARIKHTTTGSSKLDAFLYKLVSTTDYWRKPRYTKCFVEPNTNVTYKALDTPLIFRRWSESISACNLFSEALKKSPRKICKCDKFWGIAIFKNIHSFLFQMGNKIISCFLQASETIAKCCGKRSMIANAKYVSKNLFMKDLWIFIFDDVKRRSKLVDNQSFPHRMPYDLSYILGHVNKGTIHNKILALHIATEIWYNKDKQSRSSRTTLDPARVHRRELSKILSDYMLYLLLNQSNLMSAVAMVGLAQKVSAETLRELWDLIGNETMDLNVICEQLYNQAQDGVALQEPTDPLKSALNDGLVLARLLEDGCEDSWESKWVELSTVWLGLLLYAAVNIKGETHVQVLSKGGELITFVWLLMAHLGCFYKPEWGLYREYWEEHLGTNNRDDRDDSDQSIVSAVNNEYSA